MAAYVVTLLLNIFFGMVVFSKNNQAKAKKTYFLLTFIQLTLLGGLRGITVGTDTAAYFDIFYKVANTSSFKELTNLREETGFVLINKIVSLIGLGPQMVLIITSAFMAYGFLLFIYKNSSNMFLSTILLFLLMIYFTSFNVIRQYMATVLVINGYSFIKQRKVVPYVILIALACLFHKTAILFLPLYFTRHLNWNKMGFGIYIVGLVLIAVFFNEILLLVTKLLPSYKSYLTSKYFTPSGGIMAPVVTYTIFLFVSAIFILAHNQKRDKDFIMLYFLTSLLVFFTVLGQLYAEIMNRLAWYISPFLLLVLPKALNCIAKKPRAVITYCIIAVGMVYYIYCLSINWQGIMPYVPYWR